MGTQVWKEEIFGPVVCIRTFEDEEEAVKLANESEYGLPSCVRRAATAMDKYGRRLLPLRCR